MIFISNVTDLAKRQQMLSGEKGLLFPGNFCNKRERVKPRSLNRSVLKAEVVPTALAPVNQQIPFYAWLFTPHF